MQRRVRSRAALIVVICALAHGCTTNTVTAPSSKPLPPPDLLVRCSAQALFSCSAVYDGRDVTQRSRWSAAESFRLAMDVPVSASTAVDFPLPGVPHAVRRQNVYIRADYPVTDGYSARSIAPHAYRLDPSQPPEALSFLSGDAYSNVVGGAILGGVNIDIIEGESAGAHAVTLDANGSYMIEFLRLNAPFTARASKSGYLTTVKQHPGIVDDSNGYPSNTFLHFALTPQ